MKRLLLLLYYLCQINNLCYAQEPFDIFRVSSECTDRMGKSQMCHPPFISAAADRRVHSTNTCGAHMRQKYCIHMSNAGMASRCQYCDARNPTESHFPEYMTDKNPNNWWQSETMADNPQLHFRESVNLTIDLGTQFHVNYVYLQFRSPRPHAMIIYKKFNDAEDWIPWAYFSSNCFTYFGMNYDPVPKFNRPDEVICREEYSTLQPLYEGEVIFSVINGRPNYERFFEDNALQRWSTASQIKVELKKMHTFGDERGAEKDTLLTYYFAVQKFTVGGRCLCNGHGNECRPFSGPRQRDRLVCVCAPTHHTTGDNCEQCAPDHRDAPWRPATPENANPCQPCKCNGNSPLCEFDADLYDRTGSGSHCIGCGNNTEGMNCERCKHGFFKDPIQPTRCVPCSCDPVGTVESQQDCTLTGQCTCKPGVGGQRCDRCLDDHFGFGAGGCQPCDCNAEGGLEGRAICNSKTGECYCKQNVAGRRCEKCKLGHYGLMTNDPLGCKPCNCSGHSSDCELNPYALESTSVQTGTTADLNALVENDKVIVNCPPGQMPCPACLYQDRKHVRVECNATEEGYLPCLCRIDPNQCNFCPTGWKQPQPDPRSEICKCTLAYIGDSCEQCSVGHRRDPPDGLVTDRCVPCTCNGHSTKCHPETGQCECEDNTGGLYCERCADGYFGNALAPVGSVEACEPCPCPPKAKCEQVCWPDRDVQVVCTDCPDNRAGARCEQCAENYFGDPLNGIPCEPCDCSNNVDPRDFGNCNKTTGECLKCLFGTTGKHCEQCLPGYRRNFKPQNSTTSDPKAPESALARGCSPCYCDPIGTMASYDLKGIGLCNPQNGQCNCKPGVGGLRCDVCNPGFFGFHTGHGCKPCDCHSIGAIGESCDDRTGVCKCRPSVIGRKCDRCSIGYFNLTSDGCQSCECHPDGAEDRQCDVDGKCRCKPVGVGDKCDQCKENHYDLKRGCLACPACYNLIQSRVNKLRARLDTIFGADSKPGGNGLPPNGKDLREEMNKLNTTIVRLYERLLQIGANTTVVDEGQLIKTVEALANQADKINKKLNYLHKNPLKCHSEHLNDQFNKVEKKINDDLKPFVDQLSQDLTKLNETMQTSPNDPELTRLANEVAEIAKTLDKQYQYLKITFKEVKMLRQNATTKVSEAKTAVHESKNLLSKTQQRNASLAISHEGLTEKYNKLNGEVQATVAELYQAISATEQIHNLTADVIQLQAVMGRWAEARNESIELEKELNATSDDQKHLLGQFRNVSNDLRKELDARNIKTNQLKPQFELLEQLLDRVRRTKLVAWLAMEDAKEKLERLKKFKEYVEETKQFVPEAMDKVDDLETRLTEVENNVEDFHSQAKKEWEAAERLKNSTEDLQPLLTEVKELLDKAQTDYEKEKMRLDDMKDTHDSQVVSRVTEAKNEVSKLEFETEGIRTDLADGSDDVTRMTANTEEMLQRMNKLYNQLTSSGEGGSTDDGDPAAQFQQLQTEWADLQIDERMTYLRQLNESRTNEVNFLRNQLEEFKAHYNHLSQVQSLMPPMDKCFFTGKQIEGENKESLLYSL